MPGAATTEQLILVGAIAGAHGVRGDVRLISFTGVPEDVGAYGPLRTEDGRMVEILTLKPGAKGFNARLKGVTSREAAEALKGTRLYVPRAALPEAAEEEGEFYHADLLGLAVETVSGEAAGRIVGVHDFGAGDLLEIAPEAGPSFYVPFTRAAVPVIDVPGGRAVIDPPTESEDEPPAAEEEI